MLCAKERLLPLVITVVVAITAMAVTGCGEDNGGSDGNGGADDAAAQTDGPPEAGSPAAFAIDFAKLLANSDDPKSCKALAAVNRRSITRFLCPASEETRTSMALFEVLDSATYGTGGLVEYRSKKTDRATILVYRSEGGEWGISRFGIINDPSVDTSDEENRDGYDETVNGYLTAVRERKCDEFAKYAAVKSKNREKACATDFKSTEALGKLLSRNPDAKPEYLGGNGTYGFYGLRLDQPKPAYMTISIIKTPKGTLRPFIVLDVAPGPTPKDGSKA
jgi:hypothetical protein